MVSNLKNLKNLDAKAELAGQTMTGLEVYLASTRFWTLYIEHGT